MNVTIVGCGGTGGYLAMPLLRYMEHICMKTEDDCILTLIDGDRFTESNLDRQICSVQSIGQPKSDYIAALLNIIKQDSSTVVSIPEYITDKNIKSHLLGEDYIFLCVDNNSTRKLVDDFVEEIKNGEYHTILISGGNELYDGNVQSVDHRCLQNKTLCNVHPEILTPTDINPAESCQALAPSEPQLCIANNMVASLMLVQMYKIIEYYHADEDDPSTMKFDELYFDIRTGEVAGYNRRRKNDTKKSK